MILPPFAAPKDFISTLAPGGNSTQERWAIFSDGQVLVSKDDHSLPHTHDLHLVRELFLGNLGKLDFFAGEVAKETLPPKDFVWTPLRNLYKCLSDDHFAIAGRAYQMITWDRTHSFCGMCGVLTIPSSKERCKECPACGHKAFPHMSPAVMALIKRGEKILLARSPHFPADFYSVLAGFVEHGETLEQCVMREVYEEVGIQVENITYFGSQPWPMTSSLMIGFICDWKEGEITCDPNEIEHASWYSKGNLPTLAPSLSLARLLIDTFLT